MPLPGSIDELASRLARRGPTRGATIALCDALRGAPRATLVEEVGARASRDHAGDADVLVAAARMYMAAQRLGDAQTVLVSAGKAAPTRRAGLPPAGRGALRRGDAERAMRVLERAIQFGATDPETRLWSERAKVFKSMQATAGMRAVANEVQRTAPLEAPRPPMESIDRHDDRGERGQGARARPLRRRRRRAHASPRADPESRCKGASAPQPRIADVSCRTRARTCSPSRSAATTSRASPTEFPRERRSRPSYNKDADTPPHSRRSAPLPPSPTAAARPVRRDAGQAPAAPSSRAR